MTNQQSVPDTVRDIASRLRVQVVGRLAGGEWGAFSATDHTDNRFVLKVMPVHSMSSLAGVQRAIELVESLRRSGYPAPAYVEVGESDGVVYSLQGFVAGSVPDVLTEPLARRLVDLIAMHEDVANRDPAWAKAAVEALRVGTEALWTDHGVLRSAGGRPAELLEEVVAVGQRVDPTIFREGDVVHGDFHHRNLLAVGDEVTAVFDWESATVGDARADLAKLAFWSEALAGTQIDQDAARVVVDAAEDLIPVDVRAALAGVFALQQLTFAVRTRPELLDWSLMVVERALAPRWRQLVR